MSRPRSVRVAAVEGKAVLVRADLNVPLEDGRVADDRRIRVSLPTLELVLERGAREVRVCSHLGRPKTEADRASYSMDPVRLRLRELLPDDRVSVLENTRFDPGETENSPEFARTLADGCDLFVNDAFGSAHRAHASTVGVARLLPAYAGLQLERELAQLGRLLETVERPYVVVAGGAKVEDKSGALANLGRRADAVLLGGKIAEEVRTRNPFSFPIELPLDIVAASAFAADAETRVVAYESVPPGWVGLDIGPKTVARFSDMVTRARTIFWNGPMGVFEWPRFAEGTLAIARAIAAADAFSLVGGGDTARAADLAAVADRITWISTGGGASLAFLAGRELPAVAAIPPE